ncbi:stemmadenine O-acetyltransferase [Helianthus annuus]|nr:stemmadenine O-acetyltransferase [Helianthus annuus]
MISTLSSSSSRLVSYHHHRYGGYVFSRSITTVSDRTPPQQKHHWFMSTQANLLDTTSSYNESHMKDDERDAIRVEVFSREHIKPSSPTPQNLRCYKLSILDQVEAPIYNPLMFFYKNPTDNDNKNVEEAVIQARSNHLKRSLSETLTRIYPFAGKVASELHVDCNDDGVYYVETRVDDRLDNVLKKPDNNFLQQLIPVVDSSEQVLGYYVSMVQVNHFKCGGVSITVQHNHRFADGRSSMIFMNTWSSIARQDPNRVYPSFVGSLTFPQNPQLPFSPYIPIWYLKTSPAFLKHGKSATTRFVFNALALRELKAKASKHQPVSRVLAVLAMLWKCVTDVTQSKPSILHLPVNIRSKCSPKLSENSVGNGIMGAYAKFDSDSSNPEVASMASQLKNAIEAVNAESVDKLRSENGYVGFVESLRNSQEAFSDYKTEYYMTSSLCNLGTKEADFGWGKPVWSCIGSQLNEDVPIFTNRILLVDSCCDEGIEAWVTLEKQVMDDIKCHPELLSFASVNPSPL